MSLFYRGMLALGVAGACVAGAIVAFPEAAGEVSDYVQPKPISNIEVLELGADDGGLWLSYAFDKNRCEFKEVLWLGRGGDPIVRVEFPAVGGWELSSEYVNRTKGRHVVPRAFVKGFSTLRGTRGVAIHRCGTGDYERSVETQMYP